MTCVLNPKLGVFFVVFLPQFIPAGAAVGPTFFALAALQAAEAVLGYLLLAHVGSVWLDRVCAWRPGPRS